MTTDPFERLRVDDEAIPPDPTFVSSLRARVRAALDPGLPTLPFPERTSAMTDIATARATSTLTVYICVSPAADAIAWYGDVFGAVETIRYTGDDGRVGHAELDVAGAKVMLSDEYPELDVRAPTSVGGTPVTLHLEVPDVDATYERVVAAGGRAAGEPADQAYGSRSFSMLDPFGHRWMVQTPIATPSLEELQERVQGYTVTARPSAATGVDRPVVELGYVTFGVPDTAVAGRFYGELFGWTTGRGPPATSTPTSATPSCRSGCTPSPADEAPVLYFRVDDIAAYVGASSPSSAARCSARRRTTRARTPCASTTRAAASSSGSRHPATTSTLYAGTAS